MAEPTQGRGVRVDEYTEDSAVSWYDISIAGKQFNIATRRGEAHIRNVERRVEETINELTERVQGQTTLNLALLTALNLADHLVSLESEMKAAPGRFDQQLRVMVTRLMSVIPEDDTVMQASNKEGTTAVFD